MAAAISIASANARLATDSMLSWQAFIFQQLHLLTMSCSRSLHPHLFLEPKPGFRRTAHADRSGSRTTKKMRYIARCSSTNVRKRLWNRN